MIRRVGEFALPVQPGLVAQTDAVARPFSARAAFASDQAARDVDHAPVARGHAAFRDVEVFVAGLDLQVRRLVAPGEVVEQPAAVRWIVAAVVAVGRSAAGAVDVDAIHPVQIGGRITDHVAPRAKGRDAAHVTVGERRLVGPGDAALDDVVAAARRARVYADAPAVQVSPAIADHAALPVHEKHSPHSARRFLAVMQQAHRTVARRVDPLDHHAAWPHQLEAVRRQHRHAVLVGRRRPQVRGGHVEFPRAGVVEERAGDELQLGRVGHALQDGQRVELVHRRHLASERKVRDEHKPVARERLEHRSRHIAPQGHGAGEFRPDDGVTLQAAEVHPLHRLVIFPRPDGERVARTERVHPVLNRGKGDGVRGPGVRIPALLSHEVFRRRCAGNCPGQQHACEGEGW